MSDPIVAQPDEGTDDEQPRALHAAAAALVLPVDVHVVGVPLVLVAVDYTGNRVAARRSLPRQQ